MFKIKVDLHVILLVLPVIVAIAWSAPAQADIDFTGKWCGSAKFTDSQGERKVFVSCDITKKKDYYYVFYEQTRSGHLEDCRNTTFKCSRQSIELIIEDDHYRSFINYVNGILKGTIYWLNNDDVKQSEVVFTLYKKDQELTKISLQKLSPQQIDAIIGVYKTKSISKWNGKEYSGYINFTISKYKDNAFKVHCDYDHGGGLSAAELIGILNQTTLKIVKDNGSTYWDGEITILGDHLQGWMHLYSRDYEGTPTLEKVFKFETK